MLRVTVLGQANFNSLCSQDVPFLLSSIEVLGLGSVCVCEEGEGVQISARHSVSGGGQRLPPEGVTRLLTKSDQS